MQFTPKVTELVLAELFFLSIDRANQPINVYVHSFGTQTPNKQVRPQLYDLLCCAVLRCTCLLHVRLADVVTGAGPSHLAL